MPIEIRELIIRAMVGSNKDEEKEKNNPHSTCEENKKLQETQSALDMMSEIIKEEKER